MPGAGSTLRTPTTVSPCERTTGDRAVAQPPAADPAVFRTGRIATSARHVRELARATREREPDQMTRCWARISFRPTGRLDNGRLDLVFRASCPLHRLNQHTQVVVFSVQLSVDHGYLRVSCASATAEGENRPELPVAPDIAVGKANVLIPRQQSLDQQDQCT